VVETLELGSRSRFSSTRALHHRSWRRMAYSDHWRVAALSREGDDEVTKYTIAIIFLALAGVCLLVRWEIAARQVQEHIAALRATLATTTTQELSRRYGECVPSLPDRPPQGDCAEVVHESEARSLQAVKIKPPGMMFPASVPKLQKVEIVSPAAPALPGSELIFPSPTTLTTTRGFRVTGD
jgi:hypothetical protein